MIPPAPADPHASLARITSLVTRLIELNRDLTAECDSLYAHTEVLTHQLAAREADLHTLTQHATAAAAPAPATEADPDYARLARLRAELDDYLREIDARLAARPDHDA